MGDTVGFALLYPQTNVSFHRWKFSLISVSPLLLMFTSPSICLFVAVLIFHTTQFVHFRSLSSVEIGQWELLAQQMSSSCQKKNFASGVGWGLAMNCQVQLFVCTSKPFWEMLALAEGIEEDLFNHLKRRYFNKHTGNASLMSARQLHNVLKHRYPKGEIHGTIKAANEGKNRLKLFLSQICGTDWMITVPFLVFLWKWLW